MYLFQKLISKITGVSSSIWSTAKFLFPRFIGLVNVYFFRKTNTFIKSKYSKNRQWSKSIVYFGLWFGVVSAFAFTYYNYRFIFIISYLWWLIALAALVAAIIGFKKFRHSIKPNFIFFPLGV